MPIVNNIMRQSSRRNKVPAYSWEDITVEEMLGTGSFASVFSVSVEVDGPRRRKKKPQSCHKGDQIPQLARADSTSSLSCASTISETTDISTRKRFAMKGLNNKMLKNAQDKLHASQDMTKEAEILASFPFHPHIIHLHGVSSNFWETGYGFPKTYRFMMLERLTTTLDQKLFDWGLDEQHESKGIPRSMAPGAIQQKRLMKAGALGIAKALAFLHEHRIIFRDLKPANIGFDEYGDVRLFDFGLARKVLPHEKGFQLTGCVGTLRYMAPEVALDQPYGFSADTYSFGMLLWEVCTLQKPYVDAKSGDELFQRVSSQKNAPTLSTSIYSRSLRRIMNTCWRLNQKSRPDMESIALDLEVLLSTQGSYPFLLK